MRWRKAERDRLIKERLGIDATTRSLFSGHIAERPKEAIGDLSEMPYFVDFSNSISFRSAVSIRRRSARQVLTSVIEIQDLLINMATKKIPIGFRAVRNTHEMRTRIQRLYMVDLTRHAIEECPFSILRRRPYANCVQTLAMLVIERNATMCPLRYNAADGGLMSYRRNFTDPFCKWLIDRILRGEGLTITCAGDDQIRVDHQS
jgi:hypothetical protein